jgi:hypothetical protein
MIQYPLQSSSDFLNEGWLHEGQAAAQIEKIKAKTFLEPKSYLIPKMKERHLTSQLERPPHLSKAKWMKNI